MADPMIDIDEKGALIVPPSDKPVTLAFIVAGQPIPLRLNEYGRVSPEIEAQYYLRLVNGLPTSVETKAELMDELAHSMEIGGRITWWRS